ncbi:hypothetical protein C2845_PM07G17040 [Panicum miliaceum]|uniref:Aminotransferase-like plant mobile domain-containing protein n=1 Tax=Panicum miliaceum TaxID=4540 RepID=A0A3L6SND5_PANMI|nr:hypothetical protein C2845_PM07G17040 [Panicum miliaceum]
MPIQHGRLQLSRLGRHEVAVKNDQPAFKIQSCCKPDKILVSSIGFDGLLALQRHQALDGTLSLWMLQRFDPETMTLCLDGGVSLPIRDVDVYLVLGVPFEGKKVQYNYQLSRDVVNDARVALTVDNRPPSFTVKWLEEILVKDYGNHMTDQQKTAFKLAVVLYSMACVAPGTNKGQNMFSIWEYVKLMP